jgi:hypothetical protein
VTALDPATGAAKAQYAYQLPKIPVDAPAGAPFGPDNGLSDFLAIGNKKFIAVERAFAAGIGNTIRLVLTEISDGTTNVAHMASLAGAASYMPMTRKVLLEMPITYQDVKLDNIEAHHLGQDPAQWPPHHRAGGGQQLHSQHAGQSVHRLRGHS